MEHPAAWNPFTDWRHQDIDWIKVDISREDFKQFTKRSNFKGLCHAIGFLLTVGGTGTFCYWAFANNHWILLVLGLYLHGIVFGHFGDALHEMSHNTVFKSRKLSKYFLTLYGLIYWAQNPYLYKLSHLGYHHRYTLFQNSDGEDTPNYFEMNFKTLVPLIFNVFHIRIMVENLARLFTLKPTSHRWRPSGYKLDNWEKFILHNASEKDRKQVYRFALYALIGQIAVIAVSVYFGLWFLPVLITLAPLYEANIHTAMCAVPQHGGCEANNPDFRLSCGHIKLDPISSFIYWRMEYHLEHHMFASIPCYNLRKFSEFVADQLPPRSGAFAKLKEIDKSSKEKFGNWQYWRDNFGRYKGL